MAVAQPACERRHEREMPRQRGACPLCRCDRPGMISTYRYDAIWAGLAELGVVVPEAVRARHAPAAESNLFQCPTCGLQYFFPAIAGDSEFYAEITRPTGYYLGMRYEFGQVASRAGGAVRVLDLGCGQGAFLRLLTTRWPDLKPVGVDHNRAALDDLRAAGIEIHECDVARFAEREPEAFDIVCAFQILEHAQDPRALLSAAVRLVAPRGRLFISVPNRHRLVRDSFEPLDCPPHHLTRWSAEQFREIAAQFDLSLESVSFEPPTLSYARVPHWRAAERTFALLGPRVARTAARANIRIRLPRFRHERNLKKGAYLRNGLVAHTMLAEFTRDPRRRVIGP